MNARLAKPLANGTMALLLASALLLAGCSPQVVTTPSSQNVGTVTASGTGKASATPDQAVMSFGVSKRRGSAKPALDATSKSAQQISAAVQKAGVDREDIQTQNISIYPTTGRSGKITGYQAGLSVTAKVRDLGQLSEVISAATKAGASEISGPTFDVADDTKYKQEAIQKAVDDARKNAEAMAKAAGKSVGGVVKISASDTAVRPVPFNYGGAGMDAAAVPIEPGQLDITAGVTVVFELK
jgi:uncharacterized protein YggE